MNLNYRKLSTKLAFCDMCRLRNLLSRNILLRLLGSSGHFLFILNSSPSWDLYVTNIPVYAYAILRRSLLLSFVVSITCDTSFLRSGGRSDKRPAMCTLTPHSLIWSLSIKESTWNILENLRGTHKTKHPHENGK